MGRYKVEILRSAIKEIKKLSPKDRKMVLGRIGGLSDDPRPFGSKKLSAKERYRLRCGFYRILYAIKDDVLVVFIVKVGHRKEVYR
jgi:mRNA interferase RelE/StbE